MEDFHEDYFEFNSESKESLILTDSRVAGTLG
jgi:hypothetical protein